MKEIVLRPVGHVVSPRRTDEDSNWAEFPVHIQLDDVKFKNTSFNGLEQFSHVIVVFFLDKIPEEKIQHHDRHPRDNPQWPKVGIFAQRGGLRPNRIGVTVSRILKVDGTRLHLEALDAIDGTPVLDIKPCVHEFGPRGELIQPDWMTEMMRDYWKSW